MQAIENYIVVWRFVSSRKPVQKNTREKLVTLLDFIYAQAVRYLLINKVQAGNRMILTFSLLR